VHRVGNSPLPAQPPDFIERNKNLRFIMKEAMQLDATLQLPDGKQIPVVVELDTMEVHFNPDVEAKLEQMARATGRRSDQLVENVVADFFDDVAFTRETLDRRYDDMESGRVTPIPGEEVFARLRAKSAARRAERQ
jgi:predicted transcriptional regulator